MKVKSNNGRKEESRILISLGLLAVFVTIIFSIQDILPDKSTNFISYFLILVIYGYLIMVSIFLILFLLLKATSLKYNERNESGMLGLIIPPALANKFYDKAIDLALYSPLGAFTVFYFIKIEPIISELLGINTLIISIFSISLFFVIWIPIMKWSYRKYKKYR